jgi:hypothetical protein
MTALAIATFPAEGPFLRARTRAIAEGRRVMGCWGPFVPTSIGEGAGSRHVRLGVILAGLAGGLGLFALQAWSAFDYPFNSGARPLFAWQTFLLSSVEFGAFVAALGGMAMLFRRGGLTQLNHPAFDVEEVTRASQDSFVLMLACDAGEDANATLALLAEAGATHSRLVTR